MQVLLTNLIAKKTTLITTDYNISLKYFLHYGRLIIAVHMQRFLALNLSAKHLAICHTVNDISTNSAKRVDRFETLKNQLSNVISTTKAEQPNTQKAKKGRYQVQLKFKLLSSLMSTFVSLSGNLTSNHCTEIVNLLKLKRSYGSQFCVPIQMKNPISLFFTETDEGKLSTVAFLSRDNCDCVSFSRFLSSIYVTEYSKNSMERMKQKIQTAITLSNTERTAKLY